MQIKLNLGTIDESDQGSIISSADKWRGGWLLHSSCWKSPWAMINAKLKNLSKGMQVSIEPLLLFLVHYTPCLALFVQFTTQ